MNISSAGAIAPAYNASATGAAPLPPAGQSAPTARAAPAGTAWRFSTPSADPAQFSFSMMNELLAFQQPTFFTSPGFTGVADHIGDPNAASHSTTDADGALGRALPALRRMGSPDGKGAADAGLITTENPSGLPLDLSQVDAATAASTVIGAFGTDGRLSLADYERAVGAEPGNKVYDVIAKDWTALAGSADASLSAPQLSAAIQTYLTAQRASDSQTWGWSQSQGGFAPV